MFDEEKTNHLLSLEKDNIRLNREIEELYDRLEEEKAKRMLIEQSFFWRTIKPARLVYHKFVNEKGHMIRCGIDQKAYVNNELTVCGWIFSPTEKINVTGLYAIVGKRRINLPIRKNLLREDLRTIYEFRNASHCGFFCQQTFGSRRKIRLYLEYKIEEEKTVLKLGSVKRSFQESVSIYAKLLTKHNLKKAFSLLAKGKAKELLRVFLLRSSGNGAIPMEKRCIFYDSLKKKYLHMSKKTECQSIRPVDIIVPVYNGVQFFDRLFTGVEKTKVPYRLIIVDDCSPDPKTGEWLRNYADQHENVVLLHNEQNLGFVKTANKGLAYAENDVVLLNTDVQVPDGWLERLMAPIWQDPSVASATPYTNSGTICSFPNIGEDNLIFNDIDVDKIDAEFKKIRPQYTVMPTGVGFCMAISRSAIEKVGFLDDVTFGKGYGEENDWCQRAIQCKMKNVMVENLYTFHNHGGSFLSEEKQRLLEENTKKLLAKHPHYLEEVSDFFQRDPLYDVREYVFLSLTSRLANKKRIYFNHQLKGGADAYLVKRCEQEALLGDVSFVIEYDHQNRQYQLKYIFSDKTVFICFDTWNETLEFLHTCQADEVVINELVTYPNLYQVLKNIKELAKQSNAKLTMLLHDFFAICPATNLLNDQEEFCRIPQISVCEQCMKKNKFSNYLEYNSMKDWRQEWKNFLVDCDEIRVFSQDSQAQLEKAYGELSNICVVPHVVDYVTSVDKKYKTTDTVNIGLLGNLSVHKGLKIVKRMLEYIEQNQLKVNIVLLGTSEESIASSHFIASGRYTPEMIPSLILKYDIDLFFIASIWPETFSYTTEEVIKMNMPIAVFNFGAPAERVRNYSKGIIVDSMEPEDLINKMLSLVRNENVNKKDVHTMKKTLFLITEPSYATRYRVEHLQEQLLYEGERSEIITLEMLHAKSVNVKEYERLVIYRCEDSQPVSELIKAFHDQNKKVWYEVDDLIFDYGVIKGLDLVQNAWDVDYKEQCIKTRMVMEQCDGFMTSTTLLKLMIEKTFPNKRTVVHRNVASNQMIGLSQKAWKQAMHKEDKVVLGYFSGSWTHNKDFESIKNVLLELLAKYPSIELVLGGALEIPSEFSKYQSRINTFAFKDWKELPAEIARVDINLMPLEDTVFHACKSENKWMEAAWVKVPTVASYNEELSKVIVDDETGFLCKTEEDWKEVLERLVNDRALGKKIGENANQKVMKDYTTHHLESEVLDLMKGKDAAYEAEK